LTAAVRDGSLRRLRKGIYAVPTASTAAVAAIAARGRLSCTTAARSYGLWAGDDVRLHLQFAPNARAGPRDGAVCHWFPVEPQREAWRVSVEDCLRSVARCADEETAVAVFDTAISAGLTNPVALREVLSGQPANVRARASLARAGSDSGVESIVRQRLQRWGHVVDQQVHVGGVGRVDMRIDGTLYLEIDGFAFHKGREQFERDRARDAVLAARGLRSLRVSAAQVMGEWEVALSRIRSVLAHSANSQQRWDHPRGVACSIY
jgi:very-short-patch-repair endonuclease